MLDNIEDVLDKEGHLTDSELNLFLNETIGTNYGLRIIVTTRMMLSLPIQTMRFDNQIHMTNGLPISDGIAFLQEMDHQGDFGFLTADGDLLKRVVELAHGVPRALEVILTIFANDPFLDIETFLTEHENKFYNDEVAVR